MEALGINNCFKSEDNAFIAFRWDDKYRLYLNPTIANIGVSDMVKYAWQLEWFDNEPWLQIIDIEGLNNG